jgi:hypothetical protein
MYSWNTDFFVVPCMVYLHDKCPSDGVKFQLHQCYFSEYKVARQEHHCVPFFILILLKYLETHGLQSLMC